MKMWQSARGSGAANSREGRLAMVLAAAVLVACGEKPLPEQPVDEQLLARFQAEAVNWIRSERDLYRPRALALTEEDRSRFGGYFPREILDRARVVTVRRFENPEFFSIFEAYGEPIPVDLRRARGLALVDTILIAKAVTGTSRRNRLLFHELVHLVQYQVLGLEEYMDSYVESWAKSGRSYRSIPHEIQAFELASRFSTDAEPFSVEGEVRARFEGAAPADP